MAKSKHPPEAYAALARELAEARAYQAATAEVLRVISSSVANTVPVMDAIVERCIHLFGADGAQIWLVRENDQLNLATYRGQFYAAIDVGSLPTSVAFESDPSLHALSRGEIIHNPEVTAAFEASATMRAYAEVLGAYSIVLAPLMVKAALIGVLVLVRRPVKPFTANEITLLTTFADQAVIAIENARLFRETQEALQSQTATAEILQVISESPTDVQPVFEAIAERARALCDARIGAVTRFDGELLHLVAYQGESREVADEVRAAFPLKPGRGSINGRAVLARAPVQIADQLADPEYTLKDAMRSSAARGALAVPLLREGQVIGTITVSREAIGLFPERLVTLLQTFAAQAVIAIQNVRMFYETRESIE